MGQIRPGAKQGHLMDCFLSFQRLRQGPSPSLFTEAEDFTSLPILMYFPFLTFLHNVLTLFSSAFITELKATLTLSG